MIAFLYWAFNWVDGYIDIIQHFLESKIELAPLLLLFLEEAGVPLLVPGDTIIAYTGYKLATNPHGPSFFQAFITAQIATLLGATVLFFLSRRWGQVIIVSLAKFVFVKEKHVRQAEKLFARWGILAVIVGRHIPGLRIPVTVFAATSGVKYPTFLASTFVSTSVWIFFYLSIGRKLGIHFHSEVQRYVGLWLGGVATLTVLVLLIHVIGLIREDRRKKLAKDEVK